MTASSPDQWNRDCKEVRGKDDWLFLHRDTNRALGQQSGEIVLTPHELMQWRVVLECRDAWLEQRGVRYAFVIAPNAASIYPEMLPDGFTSSPHRPVHQLLDHMSEHASHARVVYPETELVALKQGEEPFARNESHWRDPGAFRTYECLLDQLAPPIELRRLTREDLVVTSGLALGDLGNKVDPPVQAERISMRVREPRAQVISDNRVMNNGRVIVYESAGVPGTCVMFSDSFGYRIVPYIAESFGRLVFVFRPTLDFEVIDQERPSAVVSLMTERFLIRVPFDQPFTPTRVIERRKRERGHMLAPLDSSAV